MYHTMLKQSRISPNSIISWQDLLWIDFCLFFSQTYQPDDSHLNANHGEINYIYMLHIYSLKQMMSFLHNNLDNDMDRHTSL